jgi:dipeptidase E
MGSCPERLMDLTRGGRRAALIANATDAYPPEARAEGVARELNELADAGFEAEELDLRSYFDGPPIEEDLRAVDLVWVRGGDVFTLRYSLERSGADVALVRLLADDAVTYGGYSAGVCVLAPSLRGLEAVDDPARLKSVYDADPLWDGLGLLGYRVVPHVDSPGHPESAACERVAEQYEASGTAHRTLRDGEVLIIDGAAEQICTG